MKFEITRDELYGLLSAAGKCLSKKNSMPILDCFRIEVGEKIRVTTSDGEKFLFLTGDIITSDGSAVFCIPNAIVDSIKEVAEQPLTIELNEDTREVVISHQSGKFSVMSQDANVYPMPSDFAETQRVVLPSNKVLDSIAAGLFATADDEIRLVMTGIYMDMRENSVCFAATNGKILVKREYEGNIGNGGLIISKKVCSIIKAVCIKDTELTISIGEQNTRFENGNMTLICRNIEGRYPNYNAVFPAIDGVEAIMDKQTLVSALKRIMVFCNQSSGLARFSFKDGLLTIMGQDLDFSTSAEEHITCSYQGSPFDIGLSAAYVNEVLGTLDTENVKITLYDPARPVVVCPLEEEEGVTTNILIMPMKL